VRIFGSPKRDLCLQMHPDSFDVQAISNLANAYVKLEVDQEVKRYLLEFLSVVAQYLDVSEGFTSQVLSPLKPQPGTLNPVPDRLGRIYVSGT